MRERRFRKADTNITDTHTNAGRNWFTRRKNESELKYRRRGVEADDDDNNDVERDFVQSTHMERRRGDEVVKKCINICQKRTKLAGGCVVMMHLMPELGEEQGMKKRKTTTKTTMKMKKR